MSTSITTGMMNTPLANLARQSAIKPDHGEAPPPPDFRNDTSSDDAFSMDEASDSDSGDMIQHIKPAAVKPTLDLKNVPIWDNTISTRDNITLKLQYHLDEASDSDSGDMIQHIKPAAVKPTLDLKNVPIWDNTISTRDNITLALGSAGYLDTTKGKGTRQEQMILLAALRHATAHYPMARAIVNSISMDSMSIGYAAWTALVTELQGSAIEERRRLEEEITAGQLLNEPVQVYVRRCRNLWNLLRKAHGQWAFEYVAINYLIPGLHPAYDHIVDATISATNVNKRLATIIILSSFGACNIVRAASCGSEVHRDTLLWTIITQSQDIRNCGNVAAIKLADPGPFSGCRIYNPATGRKTPPLSMPVFQFSNAAYLMDAFQPSGQQEGPHAPPPMLPSAALASAQEGPPPPDHNEQHPPHNQEGDATALSAPHTRKEAQLTSHYVDLSDYHPTLVASAIAAVVRPRSSRLTALALPAPTVRVSTAPRNYQEGISSTRPNDWTKSMNHDINSITTMGLFVWVNVPELRRDNESQVIQQTAWAFAAQHEDGDIKASKAWFLSFSSFLHDFGFIGSEPGGVIHLHRKKCINDTLTTSHVTESK
eukprot:jgi/Tetstr1/461738/TSEL_006828.t1